MTRSSLLPSSRMIRLAAMAAAVAIPAQFAISAAEAQNASSSHRISTRGAAGTGQRIDLSIGKSIIIELPRDAREVFVANPKVANAVVRSARKLFIIGVADGATSIFAMDADGQQIATLDIAVGRDLNVLRQTLRTALPRAEIEVKPAGDSILLIGNVANASDATQAMDIARAFVGVSGGGAGGGTATTGAVINSLTIRGRDQVLLKVTIAEVSRQTMKQLGVNAAGSWITRGFDVAGKLSNPFTVNLSQPDSRVNLGPADLITGEPLNGSNGAVLRAMERAGVSRILAEPTLTAVSGESAKFTAGGEIPVPASQNCQPGQPCQIGVDFKPFGVSLNFTPVVLSEGRISMRVATEVTEIDVENARSIGTIQVPGFRVRKADTTIEVPSGGSMMTAGLIQQTSRQAINGFPGLLNLPILGALFRSRDYQRSETELLIMVTPYLARPADPGQIARPDDGFVDAHDAQGVLLGRLNKIYGAGKPAAAHGYRGRVGFIAD